MGSHHERHGKHLGRYGGDRPRRSECRALVAIALAVLVGTLALVWSRGARDVSRDPGSPTTQGDVDAPTDGGGGDAYGQSVPSGEASWAPGGTAGEGQGAETAGGDGGDGEPSPETSGAGQDGDDDAREGTGVHVPGGTDSDGDAAGGGTADGDEGGGDAVGGGTAGDPPSGGAEDGGMPPADGTAGLEEVGATGDLVARVLDLGEVSRHTSERALTDEAVSILTGYRDRGTCVLLRCGYLDLFERVWSCTVAVGAGVELQVLTELPEGRGTDVATVRMDARSWSRAIERDIGRMGPGA